MDIFTVGHSNRSLAELVSILSNHQIQLLVDVRGGKAWSRTFPHFNTENLAIEIPKFSIAYMRLPDLGGLRSKQNVDPNLNGEWRVPAFKNYSDYAYLSEAFDSSIKQLIALSKTRRVAYMCSEAVPWRCHRSIITDYLILLHGLNITHLLGEKQTIEGKPHSHAIVAGDKVIYPKQGSPILETINSEKLFVYSEDNK